MTSLNISLSETLKEYVEERSREVGFTTPDEYMRELILNDQKRTAQRRLDALLLEGQASGPAVEMTDQDWDDIRHQGLELLKQGRNGSLTQ